MLYADPPSASQGGQHELARADESALNRTLVSVRLPACVGEAWLAQPPGTVVGLLSAAAAAAASTATATPGGLAPQLYVSKQQGSPVSQLQMAPPSSVSEACISVWRGYQHRDAEGGPLGAYCDAPNPSVTPKPAIFGFSQTSLQFMPRPGDRDFAQYLVRNAAVAGPTTGSPSGHKLQVVDRVGGAASQNSGPSAHMFRLYENDASRRHQQQRPGAAGPSQQSASISSNQLDVARSTIFKLFESSGTYTLPLRDIQAAVKLPTNLLKQVLDPIVEPSRERWGRQTIMSLQSRYRTT